MLGRSSPLLWDGIADLKVDVVLFVGVWEQKNQCYVRLPFTDLGNGHWRLKDLLGNIQYDRDENDL
jgi:hypothetical protein